MICLDCLCLFWILACCWCHLSTKYRNAALESLTFGAISLVNSIKKSRKSDQECPRGGPYLSKGGYNPRVIESVAKDVGKKCAELESGLAEHWLRPFGNWHSQCFFITLCAAKQTTERDGITMRCMRHMCKKVQKPVITSRKEESFQKVAASLI